MPAEWPSFFPTAADDDQHLQLDRDFTVLHNFREEECAFWRGIYETH